MSYLWVTIGSALGGLLRYALTRFSLNFAYPYGSIYGTIFINIVGSFVIGYFGTLTLQTGRYAISDNMRLFVMVGICGGFTTFSSFSLQTFDLMRSGAWARAMANIVLSVGLCLAAVAAGHLAAHHMTQQAAIAETSEEEFTG
jgi:CrcB protein